jgi:simple sugar transport system permease protein
MRLPFSARNIPLIATLAVCVGLYTAAALKFDNFASLSVFVNLLTDNAFLGIASVGMTFVILSGGIDLSVGAVIGVVSIATGILIEQKHMSPALVLPGLLAGGILFGAMQGLIIQYFGLPAFLVTLAGMFLARGMAFVTSQESVPITNDWYMKITGYAWPLHGDATYGIVPCVFIGVLLLAMVIAHFTRFGRNVYALGGNEQAAVLMGLPVSRTKVLVYAVSGFCSALAGVVHTLYSQSGNATAGTGLELDAIAAVVIGGTLLTGGVGYMAGTFLGVLIFGIIQTAITFQGTLNSWWTKIAVAFLLLCFISLQKVLTRLGGAKE